MAVVQTGSLPSFSKTWLVQLTRMGSLAGFLDNSKSLLGSSGNRKAHWLQIPSAGRKAAQTIRSCQQFPCALSLLTAAANMGAHLLPWNGEAHWLPIPSAGLVTSQQTTSGKSGQTSATNGSNDPI